MTNKMKAALVGGIIALVVGFAASNGLITQQTADEIKTKSDEILSEDGTTAASDTQAEPAQPTDQSTTAGNEPAPAGEATAPAGETPADQPAVDDDPFEADGVIDVEPADPNSVQQ